MFTYDDAGMTELAAIREAELRDAETHCGDSFEANWAGSASASVMRDYAAGRVREIRASGCRRADMR